MVVEVVREVGFWTYFVVEARGSADALVVGCWGKRTVKDDEGSGLSNFY